MVGDCFGPFMKPEKITNQKKKIMPQLMSMGKFSP